MKERLISFDYLRAFACVLVTIGHLIISFQDSNIVNDSLFLDCFIKFIYCFHVYIFFYCSGYLFQKSGDNKLFKRKSVVYFRLEKFINFMILYVFFSGATYFLKVFFSSEVNSEVEYSFFLCFNKSSHKSNVVSLCNCFDFPICSFDSFR